LLIAALGNVTSSREIFTVHLPSLLKEIPKAIQTDAGIGSYRSREVLPAFPPNLRPVTGLRRIGLRESSALEVQLKTGSQALVGLRGVNDPGEAAVRQAILAPPEEPTTASNALGHPTRVRILEVVNEQDMSPIQFVQRGLAPAEAFEERDEASALSHVAYHFRVLRELGCVVQVDSAARRGATEHVYRGVARAYFSDEEWAKLPAELRCRISRTMLQGMIARAEGAILAGTFDARADRHLSWVPIEVDERGWDDLTEALELALEKVKEIRDESQRRIAESAEDSIQVTVGLLGFESPPPSVLFSGGNSPAREDPPLNFGAF
jgi:DNA-binding transcriptional ArsR family regulator